MLHKNLWAPWRMAYMQQLAAEAESQPDASESSPRCFLCEASQVASGSSEAQKLLVVHQATETVVLLNRYPYTNGHLLIAPHRHVGSLADLEPDELSAMMRLGARCETLLRQAMNCQGVNLGMNLGRCAGAGVPGHLHMHVLPRWEGDTNFMQSVSGVRVMPQALEQSYTHLHQVMQQLEREGD